jgi:hypothetical protein
MTPTETRHFRILASYRSAIDYLSAPFRTDHGCRMRKILERGKVEVKLRTYRVT